MLRHLWLTVSRFSQVTAESKSRPDFFPSGSSTPPHESSRFLPHGRTEHRSLARDADRCLDPQHRWSHQDSTITRSDGEIRENGFVLNACYGFSIKQCNP